MTEPVAYLVNGVAFNDIDRAKFYSDVLKYHKKIDIESLVPIPLYTSEQLHPRVKMTKKQYDRLIWDKSHTDLSTCLEYFLNSDRNNHFGLPSENLRGNLTQEDIARAWLNPEETIEIVPNMKWFVRSKKQTSNGKYLYLENTISHHLVPEYNQVYMPYAQQFDTKEEAEKWTNPLTEAVKFPVEVNND